MENRPNGTDQQEGTEEVTTEGGVTQTQNEGGSDLSLSELNELAGRKEDNSFKSKEDAVNYINGLKNLVGDQRLADDRKKAEAADETLSRTEQLIKDMEDMKTEMTRKDFLIKVPEAKDNLDLVELYAEKTGKTLEEAWEEKFAGLIAPQETVSPAKKVIKSNQRVTQVSSQELTELAEKARRGDAAARVALVKEKLKSMGY